MKEWIEKQIQAGFPDLKGLAIEARIPVTDRLVNEFLAEALKIGTVGEPEPRNEPAGPDLRSLLQFVQKAEVTASEGVIALNVVVKI